MQRSPAILAPRIAVCAAGCKRIDNVGIVVECSRIMQGSVIIRIPGIYLRARRCKCPYNGRILVSYGRKMQGSHAKFDPWPPFRRGSKEQEDDLANQKKTDIAPRIKMKLHRDIIAARIGVRADGCERLDNARVFVEPSRVMQSCQALPAFCINVRTGICECMGNGSIFVRFKCKHQGRPAEFVKYARIGADDDERFDNGSPR